MCTFDVIPFCDVIGYLINDKQSMWVWADMALAYQEMCTVFKKYNMMLQADGAKPQSNHQLGIAYIV